MSMPGAWLALADLACRAPDAARIVSRSDTGSARTHADLLARIACWHGALAAQPHRHCVLYLNDGFDFAAALFAAWHAGKTVLLAGDDRPATISALCAQGALPIGELPGALQAGAGSAAPQLRPLDPRSTRLRLHTSGSSGAPVAIDKRLEQLTAELETLEQTFGPLLSAGDCAARPDADRTTVWTTVSHQHIYGLLFALLWPLSAGRAFAARRLLWPAQIARCLGDAQGASVLVSSPAHLKRLDPGQDWAAARQRLRALFSSGGPLAFADARAAAALLGRAPLEVFGSTETGGVAWRQCTHAQDAWQPFADVHWRIAGELLALRSPRLPDGAWWTSSDRAERCGTQQGFRLLGRADRIVKIEEKRVSLDAIEQRLQQTPWVQEASALLLDGAVGARVAVVAVPTPAGRRLAAGGAQPLRAALRAELASALEPLALPRRWRFVAALPADSQGKVTVALLRQLFSARPLAWPPVEPAAAIPAQATPDAIPEPIPEAAQRAEMPAVHWLERSADRALARIDVAEHLAVFDGHFDAAAILPGVAQIDWALRLARDCLALPPRFLRLEALKFLRPVLPGSRLHLALQRSPLPGAAAHCALAFRLYSLDPAGAGTHEHASGRAIWADESGDPQEPGGRDVHA